MARLLAPGRFTSDGPRVAEPPIQDRRWRATRSRRCRARYCCSRRSGEALPSMPAEMLASAPASLTRPSPRRSRRWRRAVSSSPIQDDAGHFRLGLAWLRLADVKRRQLDLREVALPVMRRMRDAVNETVSLGDPHRHEPRQHRVCGDASTRCAGSCSRASTSRCMSARRSRADVGHRRRRDRGLSRADPDLADAEVEAASPPSRRRAATAMRSSKAR